MKPLNAWNKDAHTIIEVIEQKSWAWHLHK